MWDSLGLDECRNVSPAFVSLRTGLKYTLSDSGNHFLAHKCSHPYFDIYTKVLTYGFSVASGCTWLTFAKTAVLGCL